MVFSFGWLGILVWGGSTVMILAETHVIGTCGSQKYAKKIIHAAGQSRYDQSHRHTRVTDWQFPFGCLKQIH